MMAHLLSPFIVPTPHRHKHKPDMPTSIFEPHTHPLVHADHLQIIDAHHMVWATLYIGKHQGEISVSKHFRPASSLLGTGSTTAVGSPNEDFSMPFGSDTASSRINFVSRVGVFLLGLDSFLQRPAGPRPRIWISSLSDINMETHTAGCVTHQSGTSFCLTPSFTFGPTTVWSRLLARTARFTVTGTFVHTGTSVAGCALLLNTARGFADRSDNAADGFALFCTMLAGPYHCPLC
ncbi:hypothetical protein QBC37DRAFT_47517 [Rhypophila decipiens]|uniref:Uncharacterized protein n=1 Tax=Rhypophila decipiens TaxID=261697 RepID=A0AAN6YJ16_9PEZI|nr:hypothetical protein QBC37DRAFT_47517 [Rhypophila decipiens]